MSRDVPAARRAETEFGELRPSHLFHRLNFEIDDVAACLGGLLQDLELGVERAREAAAAWLAAAGGENRYVTATVQEGFELG